MALECIENLESVLTKKANDITTYSYMLKHIGENIDFYEVEMK